VPAERPPGGLEGVVVGESAITDVRGGEGMLYYRGYSVPHLAGSVGWEGVVHLLRSGELPTPGETRALREALSARRRSLGDLAPMVRAIPPGATPMEALRSGFSLLGHGWDGFPPTDEMFELLLAFPSVFLPNLWRHRHRQSVLTEPEGLGQAAAYLWRLTGQAPDPRKLAALEAYLVLVADHGMNASTFVARSVLSTWSDPASAMSAAVGSLKGPLHGGAPSLVADFLDRVGTPDRAEEEVEATLGRGERLMGFGHRVYRGEDPRARRLRELARTVASPERMELAEAVERAGLRALARRNPKRPWGLNVEFYAALVLEAAGIPRPLFPPTFALARTAGWVAHLKEQAQHNRLVRPDVRYVGPGPRPLPTSA
jgi:citrate synthase